MLWKISVEKCSVLKLTLKPWATLAKKKFVSVYSCVIAEGDSQQYSKHVVNLEKNEF